jgi:hypothetical protein
VLLLLAVIWGVPRAHLPAVTAVTAVAAPASPSMTAPPPAARRDTRTATRSGAALAEAASFQLVPVSPADRPGHHLSIHRPAPNPAPRASVQPPSPQGGWGFDISWPQCDGAYPGAHDVGVVGITDGRPFTTNPCLGSQYGWAKGSRMPGGAQAYVNLEIDGSSNGPHHCGADDHACRAYDYGLLTAVDAMGRAGAQGVRPDFWWLDVEVGNNWSDDHPDWNARTVQGAIDAFVLRGYSAGIYSSVDQWAQIVPDSYHPGVPTWLAVVGDSAVAPSLCGPRHSLTGGPVLMVQYDDHGFDQDYICAAGRAAFAAAANKPH